MKIDTSNVDLTSKEEVAEKTNEIVNEIWENYIVGMPRVIAVNLSAVLNMNVLRQIQDPGQLLYTIDKNADMVEAVLAEMTNRIGEEAMKRAMDELYADEEGETITNHSQRVH